MIINLYILVMFLNIHYCISIKIEYLNKTDKIDVWRIILIIFV